MIFTSVPLNSFAVAQKDELKIHIIDVGQADAIVLQTNKGAVMIDAGNNGDWKLIDKYVKALNIKKFDLLVATHSHEDHIGSMAEVIRKYGAPKLLMPKEKNTTKTYKDMMAAAKEKKTAIEYARTGDVYKVAGINFKVLAPSSSEYSDKNNYSVVLMAEYGENKFLLTGDAETESEHEMVAKWGKELKADVLKVGHHGSGTSTTAQFLKLVSPSIAVISVGEKNKYNHPDPLIVKRIPMYGAKNLYRTDTDGTVVIVSDGKKIEVKTN